MQIEPGHVAVVTRSASGIGFALGRALGEQGVGVVLADVEEAASRRPAALTEAGVDVRTVLAT